MSATTFLRLPANEYRSEVFLNLAKISGISKRDDLAWVIWLDYAGSVVISDDEMVALLAKFPGVELLEKPLSQKVESWREREAML